MLEDQLRHYFSFNNLQFVESTNRVENILHLLCDLIRESRNDELARFFVSKNVKKEIPKITALGLVSKDKGVHMQ